jgi:hypothetical protein
MVGHAATGLLVGDSDQDRTNARLEMRGDANNAIAAASSCRQGLDAKKNKTSPRRVKCFLLDIPFYRTRVTFRSETILNEAYCMTMSFPERSRSTKSSLPRRISRTMRWFSP